MDEYERLAHIGRLYQLHKEAKADAVIRAGKALAALPKNILKVIDSGAVAAGRQASRLAGGGVRGAGLGTLVRTSPYLAAGGAAMYAGPGEYMKGKYRQFKARQYATQPYYDPRTQRFV